MTTNTPPPGSDEAIALGCTCPVLDNGHGKGYRTTTLHVDGTITRYAIYTINLDCPLHGVNDVVYEYDNAPYTNCTAL